MKTVYKIMNNQDKVTMENFYHIRCDPELDEGFFDIQHIPCDCNRCVEQLSKTWLTNLDKTLKPRYGIEPKTCKYSSILGGYNKWYTEKPTKKKKTTNPDNMEIKYELVLHVMTWKAVYEIEYNTIGALQTSDSNTPGYYIIRWTGNEYTLQEKIYVMH